jgi:predicted RNase H-like nuclease
MKDGATTWVAGVDGCPGGWVAVMVPVSHRGASSPRVFLCSRFNVLFRLFPKPVVIAVDVPIGLLNQPEPGGRECDRKARRLLGLRRSSIFSPPARSQLTTSSGLNKQTLGIRPKILEVDRVMTPVLQEVVHESHPELAFAVLAGRPMRFNKKTKKGRAERIRALECYTHRLFPGIRRWLRTTLKAHSRRQLRPDDFIDACVLTSTARRIHERHAVRLPSDPPVDRKGLRMEIWY